MPAEQIHTLARIAQLIAECPDGITRAELEDLYLVRHGLSIETRTLQRLLAKLADRGKVERSGVGKLTRYGAPGVGDSSGTRDRVGGWLTSDARDVARLVRRPIIERGPVGYHREFLEDYVPGETWYLSLEDRTRLHHLGRTPGGEQPAGTYARAIMDRLLIDLSWASSHLEGNTYSLLDTQTLIQFGRQADGKGLVEAQMILNHKHAIEVLIDRAGDVSFNAYTLRNLHAALSEGLLPDPAAEGRLRSRQVQIAGSVFTPLGVPQQIEEYFSLLLTKAAAIPDPFEQAFFMLVQLPYLQPFEDVNKRLSRIVANLPLVQNNLCPLSFLDVARSTYVEALLGVYELNRVELMRDLFRRAYQRSTAQYLAARDSLPDPDPIRLRFRPQVAEGLGDIIRRGLPPGEDSARQVLGSDVPVADFERVVELVYRELLNLHEGNIARYRIRPTEFRAWQDKWKPTD